MTTQDNYKVNDGGYTIDKPVIDLSMENNFKKLGDKEAYTHLETLSGMLSTLSKFIYEKLTDAGADNAKLQNYIYNIGKSLDAMVLKDRIASMGVNRDLKDGVIIDPTSSGFPLAVKDFYLLEADKDESAQKLSAFPTDERMIDTALYSIFRNVYPKDIIMQMMQKQYYKMLNETELPGALKIFDEELLKSEEDGGMFRKTVERLEDHNNLPRVYTLYFKVPKSSLTDDEWRKELNYAVKDGLSTIVSMELPFLADEIEDIDGVQLYMVERFDIGPFYNRFTENDGDIKTLLDEAADNEGVMSFKKYYVTRIKERPMAGFKNFWKGMFSGDTKRGDFSPILASPTYMLMPYRLVQKAHNLNLKLDKEVQIYGITKDGEFN